MLEGLPGLRAPRRSSGSFFGANGLQHTGQACDVREGV